MFGSVGTKVLIICSILCLNMAFVFAQENSYENSSGKYYGSVNTQSEFGEYMASLRNKIQRSWTPPDVLEEGHAVVVFKVDRYGNIISSKITESSGNSLYDQSAINAVEQAAPYDEFPETSKKEVLTIQYNFDSSIVKTDKVKKLVELSDKYVNRDNNLAREYIDTALKEIEGDYASYFLYARRHKIDKLMGDNNAAKADLQECKRLKILYDKRRINTCRLAAEKDPTAFSYFTLANAYDLAGDTENAILYIDKAISMTELNHAYKRYRAEIIMRSSK